MLEESFEELVREKARRMAQAETLKEQAAALGVKGINELRAFKVGGWDAMIFDMAQSLNIDKKFASSDFRQRLIDKWEEEGM